MLKTFSRHFVLKFHRYNSTFSNKLLTIVKQYPHYNVEQLEKLISEYVENKNFSEITTKLLIPHKYQFENNIKYWQLLSKYICDLIIHENLNEVENFLQKFLPSAKLLTEVSFHLVSLGYVDECVLFLQIIRKSQGNNIFKDKKFWHLLFNKAFRITRMSSVTQIFEEMKKFYTKIEIDTYNVLIGGFMMQNEFDKAKLLIDEMKKNELIPDQNTCCTLVKGYVCFDNFNEAEKCLNEFILDEKALLRAYTTIIRGYMRVKKCDDAYRLFQQIKQKGILPDARIYARMIRGYITAERFEEAFKFLDEMNNLILKFPQDIFISIINDLVELKRLNDAEIIFKKVKEYGFKPSPIAFTTLMGGYIKYNKDIQSALIVMEELKATKQKIDTTAYNTIIVELINHNRAPEAIIWMKEMISQGLKIPAKTLAYLLKYYIQNNMLDYAFYLFNTFKSKTEIYIGTYMTILTPLCEKGRMKDALLVHTEMKLYKIDNPFSYVRLVIGYCKIGNLEEALLNVEKVKQMNSTLSYEALIALIEELVKRKKGKEALIYFNELNERFLHFIPPKSLIQDLYTCCKEEGLETEMIESRLKNYPE